MKMASMRNIPDTGPVSSDNMTNPNLSSHLSQGPSQQDLIRLLAQHFNRQFYQLAQSGTSTSSSNNSDLSSILQTADLTNGASNVNLHHSIAQYQQQQQQQYLINQDALNFSSTGRGAADLSSATLNLAQINSNEQPVLANQMFRSHQQSTQSPGRTTPTPLNKSMGGPIAAHCIEFAASPLVEETKMPILQNNLHPPAAIRLNDMNLFNALNLTNDQFLISLHQQYLLQAANQYGLKDYNNVDNLNHNHHHTRHVIQQHQQSQLNCHLNQYHQQQAALRARRNQARPKHSAKGLVELNDPHSENGRELLKFSINTILGRGSPLPTSSGLGSLPTTRTESPSNSDGRLIANNDKLVAAARASKLVNDDEGHHHHQQPQHPQLGSPDCDRSNTTDFGGDSSNSATTPTPQSDRLPSSLNVFDHYRTRTLPLDHPSAANLTNHATAIQQMATTEQNRSVALNQHSGDHHASLSFLAGTATFPWTVAARGKPRRGMMRRAVFSDGQRVGLEKRFQLQKYISKPDRKKLAEKLGLRDSQVKIWFQNRRMKWRNSKERELLSAGGSREQTLPTRNNPNPDLSDVGETVKKLAANSNSNTAV